MNNDLNNIDNNYNETNSEKPEEIEIIDVNDETQVESPIVKNDFSFNEPLASQNTVQENNIVNVGAENEEVNTNEPIVTQNTVQENNIVNVGAQNEEVNTNGPLASQNTVQENNNINVGAENEEVNTNEPLDLQNTVQENNIVNVGAENEEVNTNGPLASQNTVQENNITNVNNQSNNPKKKKNIVLKIIIISLVCLIIFFVFTVLLLFSFKKMKSKISNSKKDSYYEDSNYYITDNSQVIDNISNSTSSDSTGTNSSDKKHYDRTIMIYMVGSNLESEYAAATYDIDEMIKSDIDSYTNVYIYAGGTTKWNNQVFSNTSNDVYKIENNNLTKVKEFGNKNTGESSSLSEFINYVTSTSKTSNYDLILWDHGAGPIIGFGSDEKYDNDSLDLVEISTALSKTSFSNKNKLEFIGFDACLMGNVETAYSLKDYSNYMIASEEKEPGIGWNYKALSSVSTLDTKNFGKQIIDNYESAIKTYNDTYPEVNWTYTLSLIDLSKINGVVDDINTSFSNLNGLLNSEYENVAKIRSNTVEFGKSDAESSFDMIDLSSFIKETNGKYDFNNLSKKLDSSIIYNKTNIKNANGLAIYFPYTNTKYSTMFFIPGYNLYPSLSEYKTFIDSFNKIRIGSPRSSWSTKNNTTFYKNKKLSINLKKKQLESYSYANYIIFEKVNNEYYIPIYKDSKFKKSKNQLVADYNKKMIVVKDKDGYGTLTLIFIRHTNKGDLYYAPAVLSNYSSKDLSNWKFENGYVRLYLKDGKIKEQGIVPITDDISKENKNKITWKLKDWDSIAFTNFRYKVLDDNGNYTSNWIPDDTKYLYEVTPKKNKVTFELKSISKNKEYYAVVNVFDLQDNIHSGQLIKIN